MTKLMTLKKKLAELKATREYWGNPLTGIGGVYGTAYAQSLTKQIEAIENEIDELKRKERCNERSDK